MVLRHITINKLLIISVLFFIIAYSAYSNEVTSKPSDAFYVTARVVIFNLSTLKGFDLGKRGVGVIDKQESVANINGTGVGTSFKAMLEKKENDMIELDINFSDEYYVDSNFKKNKINLKHKFLTTIGEESSYSEIVTTKDGKKLLYVLIVKAEVMTIPEAR